jgi:hypothetical protein
MMPTPGTGNMSTPAQWAFGKQWSDHLQPRWSNAYQGWGTNNNGASTTPKSPFGTVQFAPPGLYNTPMTPNQTRYSPDGKPDPTNGRYAYDVRYQGYSADNPYKTVENDPNRGY